MYQLNQNEKRSKKGEERCQLNCALDQHKGKAIHLQNEGTMKFTEAKQKRVFTFCAPKIKGSMQHKRIN